MYKRLLIPLDGSRFGSRALTTAIEIAKRFNAEIFLLQVIKPAAPIPPAMGMTGTGSPAEVKISMEVAAAEDKRNASLAKQYLSRKTRELRSRGIKASYQAVIGEPADTIMKLARRKKSDLIIMSSHGKGGLKRAILGSVTDEVIRKAGKPVLVVRPKS
jgi:nucleotide-binding universal stress UspA family protein